MCARALHCQHAVAAILRSRAYSDLAGLAFERALQARCLLRAARGAALLMARAYKANGEWAARDFCCDFFGVRARPGDQE
eukprot:3517872-Prymnesium_polylepis.2